MSLTKIASLLLVAGVAAAAGGCIAVPVAPGPGYAVAPAPVVVAPAPMDVQYGAYLLADPAGKRHGASDVDGRRQLWEPVVEHPDTPIRHPVLIEGVRSHDSMLAGRGLPNAGFAATRVGRSRASTVCPRVRREFRRRRPR